MKTEQEIFRDFGWKIKNLIEQTNRNYEEESELKNKSGVTVDSAIFASQRAELKKEIVKLAESLRVQEKIEVQKSLSKAELEALNILEKGI